jgi:hypothetical protein
MSNYHFQKTWPEISQEIQDKPEKLLEYLKGNQDCAKFIQKTQLHQIQIPLTTQKVWFDYLCRFLKLSQQVLWSDASQLYGRAYVTKSLKKKATVVSLVIGSASGINILSLYPLVSKAFSNLGLLGPGISLATTLLALITSNACGTVAAANQPRYRAWSKAGSIGFALLNITLTLIAGPGMEVLNSEATLREDKAREVIAQIIKSKADLNKSNLVSLRQQAATKKQDCKDLNAAITALDKNHPDRDRMIIQAQGRYRDQNTSLKQNIPLEALSVCEQAGVLESQIAQHEKEAAKALNDLKGQIAQGESVFLKKRYPETYRSHFDSKDKLLDNGEAVRLAIVRFNTHLLAGNFSTLGFSLSFFLLSAVTSASALIITIIYARSLEAKQSWNPVLERMRDELFEAAERGLLDALKNHTSLTPQPDGFMTSDEDEDENDIDQQKEVSQKRLFLHQCATAIRESGMFDFPPFVRFIEQNPLGERLLSNPIRIFDPTQNRHRWTDKPDMAVRYLIPQIEVMCHKIVALSQSFRQLEPDGNLSRGQTIEAISQEIRHLQSFTETVKRSFDFVNFAEATSLFNALNYAQEYIRSELQDAVEVKNEASFLERLDHQQLQTSLTQIESLSLQLAACLTTQLQAGIAPPYPAIDK